MQKNWIVFYHTNYEKGIDISVLMVYYIDIADNGKGAKNGFQTTKKKA